MLDGICQERFGGDFSSGRFVSLPETIFYVRFLCGFVGFFGGVMKFRNNLIKQKHKALKVFVGNPQEKLCQPVPDSTKNT